MLRFLSFMLLACLVGRADVTGLGLRPVDAAYSIAMERMILITANPNQVHIYNPVNHSDLPVALAESPVHISLGPDGLHAAVAFSDGIAYVDLQAGTVVHTYSNLSIGSGQVLLGSGYIYVIPSDASGTISISLATAVVTSNQQASYTAGGVFDAAVNAIYGTNDTFYPVALDEYDTSAGVVGNATSRLPAQNFCAPLFVSNDGSNIYSRCGTVFGASTDQTKNLSYLGTMQDTMIRTLAMSPALGQIAAIPFVQIGDSDGPNADTVVKLFDSSSFNLKGQFATTPFVVNGTSFPAHGRWVFYNSSASALFIVTQADVAAALAQDYAIETVDLTNANSCNASFGGTSAAATSAGGYGTAQILAGEDCVFSAISNVPWITVTAGTYGSGNTTLTYLARPNLTSSARAGTISIGSQSFTVSQNPSTGAAALNLLSYKPAGADYSKALDKIVMVSGAPNELHIYDPVTQADQIVALSYTPLSVSVRPDGLFAAVGHRGYISIVDLQGQAVSKILVVPIENAAVVLAGNGYVYSFPAGTSTVASGYSTQISTGSGTGFYPAFGQVGRLNADGTAVYFDNGKLDISNGPATAADIKELQGNLWPNENGTRLILSDGTALSMSSTAARDLQPIGRLSAAMNVDWAADSQVQQQTAVLTEAADVSPTSVQLQIYSDGGLQLQSQETLPGFASSVSHGRYLFWNAAASKLFAIIEADSSSGLLSDFAEYTVDAPESLPACTYAVSPNTLNMPFYPSIAYENVTSNCNWSPGASNQDWLSVYTPSINTGNGQIVLYSTSLSGTSQSATITVGNQSFQVTQAPASCHYSLSSSSRTFSKAGGSGSVVLTTGDGCAWSIGSTAPWLTFSGNQNGAGSATIQYAVAASPNLTAQQLGTLSIGGNLFNVTQTTAVSSVALNFVPLAPCRVLDTRNASGEFGGPYIGASTTRTLVMSDSDCNIPANAQAYALNITVVPHGRLHYITAWPGGETQPLVSTLNADDGRIKADAAIVGGGTNGSVSFFATDDTDLVVDINGYFVDANGNSGLNFYAVTPCRAADTRLSTVMLGGPALAATEPRNLPLQQSACNLPSSAAAYSLNVTAIPVGAHRLAYVSLWPTGQSQPLVSTLNDPLGIVLANAAIVQAGTSGGIDVMATSDSHLVIDVDGYFAPPGTAGLHFYAVPPCRLIDTRNSNGPFLGELFVQVGGTCNIPMDASAVVLNATVIPRGDLHYITLWPWELSEPLVSTLNAENGSLTSNMAIVPMGGAAINVASTDETNLLLDVSGYFAQ